MIKEKINGLIAEAMKAKDSSKLKVLRLIKSEYQKFETTKDNKGNLNILDEGNEVKILKKLYAQFTEETEAFKKAGRDISEMEIENNYLKSLIPEEPSSEEQESLARQIIETYLTGLPIEERRTMKHLGAIMKIIKDTYPCIEGKRVSEIYKKVIGM